MADGLHPTNPNRSMHWTKHDETTFEAKDLLKSKPLNILNIALIGDQLFHRLVCKFSFGSLIYLQSSESSEP